MAPQQSSESIVRKIKYETRRKLSQEEKIRMILEDLNGKENVADVENKIDSTAVSEFNAESIRKCLNDFRTGFNFLLRPRGVGAGRPRRGGPVLFDGARVQSPGKHRRSKKLLPQDFRDEPGRTRRRRRQENARSGLKRLFPRVYL